MLCQLKRSPADGFSLILRLSIVRMTRILEAFQDFIKADQDPGCVQNKIVLTP